MFDDIQHIGYFCADLGQAVSWFERAFGGVNAGGGAMAASAVVPGGGVNAFVRFGGVEVELMQLADSSSIPRDTLVMHHVGYVVADIVASAALARAKGLKMLTETAYTNPMGQQVHYFDPASTNGVWMHLTQVPPRAAPAGAAGQPRIESIVHPGFLVADLDAATAWYVEKLGGVLVGGGPSRRGGRVAFIDCGGAQVELIEPQDAAAVGAGHVIDHVGYRTRSIVADMPLYRQRGLGFATEAASVNPIGQKLIYFDTGATMGARMHLTEF